MREGILALFVLFSVMVLDASVHRGVTSGQSLGEWSARAPMPTARKEISNATLALDGNIYVIGGVARNGMMTDALEVYDPATDTWATAAPLPMRMWRTSAATAGGKLYVFGGYRSLRGFPFGPSNRVFQYDPDTDQWTEKAPLPTARGASVSVEVEGRIHVLGGAGNTALDVHEVYDPLTDSWTREAPLPTPRSGLTAAVIDGHIYAAGGYILSDGVVPQNVLEAYDPVTGLWRRLQHLPIARVGVAAAAVRGKMYVFGGATSATVTSRTLEYDPVSDGWRQLADMPDPVSFMGVATVRDTIYVIGGGAVNLNRLDGLDVNRAFIPPRP